MAQVADVFPLWFLVGHGLQCLCFPVLHGARLDSRCVLRFLLRDRRHGTPGGTAHLCRRVIYGIYWTAHILLPFHDIYNHLLLLGRHADKKNFADIFFNQNHGIWILLSYIPYIGLCYLASSWLLALPSVPYLAFDTVGGQYAFNTIFS